MPRELNRREALGTLATCVAWGGLASLPLVSACAPAAETDRALVEALRRCFGSVAVKEGAAMSRQEALAVLRADRSDLELRALLASDWMLRRALRSQIAADLAAGRTRSLDGWIVAETEAAVAVLLA